MLPLVGLVVSLLPAIWIVDASNGPGANFVDLPPAVAAAASGDVIVVRPGIYTAFVVSGKALTIRGSGSSNTIVQYYAPATAYPYVTTTISNVPAGTTFYIDGMTFHTVWIGRMNLALNPGIRVIGPGTVALADVVSTGTYASSADKPGLHLSGGAAVHAARSSFTGGYGPQTGFTGGSGSHGAFVAAGCALEAEACTFTGGFGEPSAYTFFPAKGGAGVLAQGGLASLTHCSFFGGGTSALAFGGEAVRAILGGFVRVSGTPADLLQGGFAPVSVNAGFAIQADGASAVVVHGSPSLVPATPGAALLSGPVTTGAPLLPRLSITGTAAPSGEILASQIATVTLDGLLPSAPFILAVDVTAGFPTPYPPAVVGEVGLVLPPASYFSGTLDSSGFFSVSFVPATLPGLTDIPLYAQCAVFDAVAGQYLVSNVAVHFYRN